MSSNLDAIDDNRDVKLYRASADLLPEIRAKLPQFVWQKPNHESGHKIRKWVPLYKLEELIYLFDRFQEWPQLLDPHLTFFLQELVDSFLLYLTTCSEAYDNRPPGLPLSALPLPRAICQLLYVLTKVRGLKVIVQFLNNEPKYMEPLIKYLVQWKSLGPTVMKWEEQYIVLVWLSHLTLTPFDLANVSSTAKVESQKVPDFLPQNLPSVANSLLGIGLASLTDTSKAREAAGLLLVRLALRRDMQQLGLLESIVEHIIKSLEGFDQESSGLVYRNLGLLSLLSGIMISGSDDDVALLIRKIFAFCIKLAIVEDKNFVSIRNSAPVRKVLIKILRASLMHALSLSEKSSQLFTFENVDPMVENTVQYLLESLADKDTPVRMAASKALSIITLKLEPAMAAEVIQAVVDSFNENLLYDELDGPSIRSGSVSHKKQMQVNFSAVDPLHWHGLMLTLGHLLFRRAPPPDRLALVIRSLLAGLNFEQRSNAGTSVGVSVRDAACFGIWAMSRKYSTVELEAIDVGEFPRLTVFRLTSDRLKNIMQLLATELVVSACLDPSGNIRRGSSAALQEFIGRHPDTITEGISLVQIVNYHAVARRSGAMNEVAVEAAELCGSYFDGLLAALLDWRGAKAADAEFRRVAAKTIGNLLNKTTMAKASILCSTVIKRLTCLKPANSGTTAEARHGYLLALAAAVEKWSVHTHEDLIPEHNTSNVTHPNQTLLKEELGGMQEIVEICWKSLDALVGELQGRVTRELEYAFEASCVFISSLARFPRFDKTMIAFSTRRVVSVLERCQTGSEKDIVIDAAAKATVDFVGVLSDQEQATIIESWLTDKGQNQAELKHSGRIMALGAVYPLALKASTSALHENLPLHARILQRLEDFLLKIWPIETKICAMRSFSSILEYLDLSNFEIEPILLAALTDYTTDRRGDIGFNLRLEGVKITRKILALNKGYCGATPSLKRVMGEVVRLAAEKMDKLRYQAWLCLQEYWQERKEFPQLMQEISHGADVSSVAYFRQILGLFQVDWLRASIVCGIASSAASGTEDLGRVSRSAIIEHFLAQPSSQQAKVQNSFLRVLAEQLESSTNVDRVTVPCMELLAFLVDQGFSKKLSIDKDRIGQKDLLKLAHNLEQSKSSFQRLEALLRIYSSLTTLEETKNSALERLTRMLLHRYPLIRNAAADALALHSDSEDLLACNWTNPTPELKPVVKNLRKSLAVV